MNTTTKAKEHFKEALEEAIAANRPQDTDQLFRLLSLRTLHRTALTEAVTEEREACATVVDHWAKESRFIGLLSDTCDRIAAAIRRRST